MTEFVIRLADERGKIQEQTHSAATADELRSRFTQAGYYVLLGEVAECAWREFEEEGPISIPSSSFNQQFLTLIKAGLPILGSLELLARRQKIPAFRAQLEDVGARVKDRAVDL